MKRHYSRSVWKYKFIRFDRNGAAEGSSRRRRLLDLSRRGGYFSDPRTLFVSLATLLQRMRRNRLTSTHPVEIQRTISSAESVEKPHESVEFHAGYTPRRAQYTGQRASVQDIPLARSPRTSCPSLPL